MKKTKPVYIIDAGNTSIKVARFEGDTLIYQENFDLKSFYNWAELIDKKNIKSAISSVLSDKETARIFDFFPKSLLLTHKSSVPIQVNYDTTHTLGMDRLCNAVYLKQFSKTKHAVSIDIGTCIKFDLISLEEGYLGGSISPGIDLRYKSLNDYTGKLPLLSNKSTTSIVG
ncbi:MAG: type III pantothenate kinase, partial [Crocinitomicaceae bacterium]|nr:type III pantothenate kinase [Crocinitomicaceae bacterium]